MQSTGTPSLNPTRHSTCRWHARPCSQPCSRRRAGAPRDARRVAAQAVAADIGRPIDFLSLRGVLFDIDGTLGNSDPLHYIVYRQALLDVGFNNGQPITEQWFMERIAGRHNPEITADLFPDRPQEWRDQWCDNREARFRELAARQLTPVQGLQRFVDWVTQRQLRRAAVTNAPRPNAEVMVGGLGLQGFFETLVIGDECQRGKPYPDPYMVGLVRIGLRHVPQQVLVLEDSPSGVRAAVAAGLPVVGLLTARPRSVLEEAGAKVTVNNYDELMELIEAQERATRGAASAQ